MPPRLPATLTFALAFIALVTFAAGVYLELRHPGALQDHPYFSNLLSGATGFSVSALVVAHGVSAFISRDRAMRMHGLVTTVIQDFRNEVGELDEVLGFPVPMKDFHGYASRISRPGSPFGRGASRRKKVGDDPARKVFFEIDRDESRRRRVDQVFDRVLDQRLPDIVRALDLASDYRVISAVSRLRETFERYGGPYDLPDRRPELWYGNYSRAKALLEGLGDAIETIRRTPAFRAHDAFTRGGVAGYLLDKALSLKLPARKS
ncbi:hypothetical protein GCM10010172_46300 [Paractinoplanes ferrugineus]|uniref:Uncharacterized protein n=1 Tax=Paractinoplanes ferrugineus TaxID=113564 RepID=A0A919JES3_9ACTN|nr:hypothetical protein [Actinoplanes ferrugineus]GIE15846.1 hypothetical protein Afe05nite_76860 [Actinoplanes ferrugineus]